MNFSAIEAKIEKVAFDLFRCWVKKIAISHPDLDFTIKDESRLSKDLKNTIEKSLHSLYENEGQRLSKTNIFQRNWNTGFIFGFIQSNLNGLWFHEYVIKRSDEYKQIIVLSALQKYIQYDETAKFRILHIYRELLEEDINIRDYDDMVRNFEFDITDLSISSTNAEQDDSENISTCIEKIRIAMIFRLVSQQNELLVPRIDGFFTVNQIEKLIADNKDLL